MLIIESISPTLLALKAYLTLPLLRNVPNLRVEAIIMEWSVTLATEIEHIFIGCLATLLA